MSLLRPAADNAVNSTPSCGNAPFQEGVLRAEWGFEGCVILPMS